jgi:hypothetical protein
MQINMNIYFEFGLFLGHFPSLYSPPDLEWIKVY